MPKVVSCALVLVLFGCATQAPGPAVSRKWVNGCFARPDLSRDNNTDTRLGRACGEVFNTPEGLGLATAESFVKVCRVIGKECDSVFRDDGQNWRGDGPCGETSAVINRAAFCKERFDPNWYGYDMTSSKLTKEAELYVLTGGFVRIKGASGGTFDTLCKRIGLTCDRVIDFNNQAGKCSNAADDGRKLAYCEP